MTTLARRRELDTLRRHLAQRLDQAAALLGKRLRPPAAVAFDGDSRFALIVVNFSTTRYVKLLLLTLTEQESLSSVHRIVVVDNGSRDGGGTFLRALAERVPKMHLVERHRSLHHAVGMRAGVRALDRIDGHTERPANQLLFCDADVALRDHSLFSSLAGLGAASRPALIGEVRVGVNPEPDIQASFLVVRRDIYARRDILPLVHHGSPTYWMQCSIRRAGLSIMDFPSNHGGYLLHRGRAGVAAASVHLPRHAYASVANRDPHFMGVPNGGAIWSAIEARWSALLDLTAEARLIDYLTERLSVLGRPVR